MPQGISGRALAKELGVSEGAIRKAVEARRISRLADGTFDPEACRAAWAETTDPVRTKVRTEVRTGTQAGTQPPADDSAPTSPAPRSAAAPLVTEGEAREAVALIRRVLMEEGVALDPGTEIGLGDIRMVDGILKARQRDMDMAARRGELVEIETVGAEVERAFAACRARLLAIPGNLAVPLTNEPDPNVIRDRIFGEVSEALNELATERAGDAAPAGSPDAGAAEGA